MSGSGRIALAAALALALAGCRGAAGGIEPARDPAQAASRFTVQVGVFTGDEEVMRVMEELKALGHDSWICARLAAPHERWKAVCAGRFATQEEAGAAKEALRARGYAEGLVRIIPGIGGIE